jgi:hypothetical protein
MTRSWQRRQFLGSAAAAAGGLTAVAADDKPDPHAPRGPALPPAMLLSRSGMNVSPSPSVLARRTSSAAMTGADKARIRCADKVPGTVTP